MPTSGQFVVGEIVTASDANSLFVRGYRNRIINGAFVINQRGYTSGTNLASGSYGFDRWKSGYTNTALTFTAGSQATTVTISSAGVLQQIIERQNMPAATYILSWTGTATGRVYNSGGTPPGYAASPVSVTLDGLANVVVEFTASGGTRTLGTVQLEAGSVFSPFEYRLRGEEIALCQRYYEKSYDIGTTPGSVVNSGSFVSSQATESSGTVNYTIYFKVEKRVFNYTIQFWQNNGTANRWSIGFSGTDGSIVPTIPWQGEHNLVVGSAYGGAPAWVPAQVLGHWAVSAEL
jgi:hypothetical protein